MAAIHYWRCWNTLYMHELDLLWVWRGLGVLIITYHDRSGKENILLPPLWLWDQVCIRLELHPYGCNPLLKELKHFIYAWARLAMSMKCVRFLNQNLQHDRSGKPREYPTSSTVIVGPSIYQVWAAPPWPLATVECAETLYICTKLICCEYEVNGFP